jgi:ribosomal protein L35
MAKKGKTRKSITKRFKFTKSGKILRLKTGRDHLLAKKISRQKARKKGFIQVDKTLTSVIKKNLFQ